MNKIKFTMENGGEFTVELCPEQAPITCENFLKLVKSGFYNGLTFHRVIDGFMAQGGDPNGNGMGGSDENIKGDEKTFIMSLENTYGNDIIILGRGDKGALMYVKSEARFYELPAVTVGNVVNTVGAGDALCSSFVHYYAKGFKADEALMRAQIFASYKIGFDGASVGFATEEKVEELWENFY